MASETWDSVPQRMTAAECGQGKEDGGVKKEATCRSTLLERLKLRSPELPAALEADWPQIRDNYAKKIGERQGRNTGVTRLGQD